MPVTINGNGSITGLSVGGLPNGTVDADTLASNAVTSAKLASGAVIQVQSTNFNTELNVGSSDGTGQATINTDFSFIPSASYVNITALENNSKYMITFNGNMTAVPGPSYSLSDWIGAFGFVVDPAGGTNWTPIGGGENNNTANNVKYFSSRSSPFYDNDTVGGDGYWKQAIGGNYLYTSSVNAGTTLRFAIEYFSYDNSYHESMMINRGNSGGSSSSGGNRAYQGSNATTLTVMEIKA